MPSRTGDPLTADREPDVTPTGRRGTREGPKWTMIYLARGSGGEGRRVGIAGRRVGIAAGCGNDERHEEERR